MRYTIAVVVIILALVFGPVGSDPIGVIVGLLIGAALGGLWSYGRGWNDRVQAELDETVERAEHRADEARR